MTIQIDGTQQASLTVPSKNGGWDLETLLTQLKALHEKYPTLEGGVLNVEDAVLYGDVVKALEQIKKVFSQVSIGADLNSS